MKTFSVSSTFTVIWSLFIIKIAAEEDCTHGKLFISDSTSSTLYVANLDDGFKNLTVTKLDLKLGGSPPLYLDLAADDMIVTAAYWGSEEMFMADGFMNLVHSGVGMEDHGDHVHIVIVDPYVIANTNISCGPAYHPVSHHGILVVSCDGFMEAEPQINTTIMVFDESKFSEDASAESALVTTYTLAGSHHGVGIPVDEGHVLHSLATEDRVNRVGNTSSLPDTFQVVDYEGIVLHELTDTSDPSQSCFGFHGLAHFENTFYFACSHDLEEHGGMLIVDYDDTTESYSSRHLLYPNTNLSNHRSGGIVSHSASSYIVADFADWDAEVYAPQLMALSADTTQIEAESVLNLGELGQCDYGLEQSEGKLVVVLLPSGMVQVYSPLPAWTLLAEKQVLEPTDSCPWPAPFTVGYMNAFLFSGETLYVLDLNHVEDEGTIEMYSTSLGFVPYSMKVAGVPKGLACTDHSHGGEHTDDEHDHTDDEDSDPPAAAPSSAAHYGVTYTLVTLAAFLLATVI